MKGWGGSQRPDGEELDRCPGPRPSGHPGLWLPTLLGAGAGPALSARSAAHSRAGSLKLGLGDRALSQRARESSLPWEHRGSHHPHCEQCHRPPSSRNLVNYERKGLSVPQSWGPKRSPRHLTLGPVTRSVGLCLTLKHFWRQS